MSKFEDVMDDYGRTVATLEWKDNGNGTEYANIDNGVITRTPGVAEVKVDLQNRNTGAVTSFTMPSVAGAFYSLGLCAERCNGIDGWLEFSLMQGPGGGD